MIFSCQSTKDATATGVKTFQEDTSALSRFDKKGGDLLDSCIHAHGGLEKWQSFKGLEYDLDDNGKKVYQLTQLKDRRSYIRSSKYEVGFDGKVAWARPDAKEVSGGSAAFYYNLDFYFIGIPFLLKDEGVRVTSTGKTIVNGKSYESLKIAFEAGTGLTPEDVYYLYLDPNTYLLKILTYSISYFDKDNARVNSAKVYDDYRDVQGILMPHKMDNFEWKDGAMGARKNHLRIFSNIRFLTDIVDEVVFRVPPGAVEEVIGH